MPHKPRTKPKELTVLELLKQRMPLTSKDQNHYFNLQKGYEGELIFDSLTEKLQCDCLILNDLLFEVGNITFQIDSLLIIQGKVYFYEVKNYEGDYYFESDKLYKKPKLEVINPILQLSRSESLLRQLLHTQGFNLPIDASVVFINPAFTLYQAPLDKPIIFPTQVKRYLSQINAAPSKLTDRHYELADMLVSMHKTESRYTHIPQYTFNQLRKGIVCRNCGSFNISVMGRNCVCQVCKHSELVTNAILRSIKEFRILFPNERITTNIIQDWCQVVKSEKRIRRVLLSNFIKVGDIRWSYYK